VRPPRTRSVRYRDRAGSTIRADTAYQVHFCLDGVAAGLTLYGLTIELVPDDEPKADGASEQNPPSRGSLDP
jgi:hypothetical protein